MSTQCSQSNLNFRVSAAAGWWRASVAGGLPPTRARYYCRPWKRARRCAGVRRGASRTTGTGGGWRVSNAAGAGTGAGLRRPQRPRHAAARALFGQGGPDRGISGAGSGPRVGPGGQEHVEPASGPGAEDRYKKVSYDAAALDALLVGSLRPTRGRPCASCSMSMPPTTRCTANSTATTGCYLPLYVFCGAHVLCARLPSMRRRVAWIVARVRQAWPTVAIVRGDSGF